MAFVDELQFYAKAGDGGNGVVRWRQEKYIPKGGPAGGDGGAGGDVVIIAVRDLGILAKHAHRPRFVAGRGADGEPSLRHGVDGKDVTVPLPVGSVVTNIATSHTMELLKEGQEIVLLKGGVGGFGNAHFKGPENTTPQTATNGAKGEEADFHVELRMIADAGFVGLPNAGKSSLLNELTRAAAKVGAYPFTTLDPNLGDYHGYILADVPGLIEGASTGKGLGHKFLRHLARTRFLVHCVSLENEEPFIAYETIRSELTAFENLAQKPECIVLTKADLVTPDRVQQVLDQFQGRTGTRPVAVSILDNVSLAAFKRSLSRWLSSGAGA